MPVVGNTTTFKRPLFLCLTIGTILFAIALHGIDNVSSLNVIFPIVLDGIQALFGSSRKDQSLFEYADDGLPLCNGCHCTPNWDEDPSTFVCPNATPPPPWQYPPDEIQTLSQQVLHNPFTLHCNPYSTTNETCDTVPSLERSRWEQHHNAVCGLIFDKPPVEQVEAYMEWKQQQQQQRHETLHTNKDDDDDDETSTTITHRPTCPLVNYTMQTFASSQEAALHNAVVTHVGPCGTCSSTQDLAGFMTHIDMVHAGRRCTNQVLLWGHEAAVRCYMALGFTQPCASIWAYNSYNTATVCRKLCVLHLFSPPNQRPPSCKLNDCLHCDEVESGPNFRLFAGRNRRNSGLRTPILRPCLGLANIVHDSCPVEIVMGIGIKDGNDVEQ